LPFQSQRPFISCSALTIRLAMMFRATNRPSPKT
jgi:hypothetical protein